MAITIGIDVGSSAIKTVVSEYEGGTVEILHKNIEKIRKRSPLLVIDKSFKRALKEIGCEQENIDYIATTGEGENVEFRDGHFYGMTTHAKGASFLYPDARSVVDIGALHARAIMIDSAGRVLAYKMTGQCASGSGQFVENIARYLGVSIQEVGPLSLKSTKPEKVSSICAVLAETDVINMVSRGILISDILKGIHQSIADRLVKLLRAINAESPVVLTGGLANDVGLLAAIKERLACDKLNIEVKNHPDSLFAGAIGAAIWAGYRFEKLRGMDEKLAAS